MTDEEATSIALKSLEGDTKGVFLPPLGVHYKQRHMTLGKSRSGWIVLFRLDVPDGFEPNLLRIEVYEDDHSTNIPPLM